MMEVMAGGSDKHHSFEELEPASKITGIALDQKLDSISNPVQRILYKQPLVLNASKAHGQVAESEPEAIASSLYALRVFSAARIHSSAHPNVPANSDNSVLQMP